MQNIFEKKIKRKNFFTALAAATAGYFVMRTAAYKLFGMRSDRRITGTDKIKININSLAVSRKKLSVKRTNKGDNDA